MNIIKTHPDNLRKIVIYLVIAVSIIVISLVMGLTDNFLAIAMLMGGIFLFFYALLRPWEKASYYAITGGICLMLLIFEIFAGVGILVKMQLKGDLAEQIGFCGSIHFYGRNICRDYRHNKVQEI